MFQYLLLGSGFAFAAAVQPGPLQAFLLSSVARHGWKRTLPAALAPLLSDGPIILLALLVLKSVPPRALDLLQAAGGVFLLYLAWLSYRQWRTPSAESQANAQTPNTLGQAVLVNLLNPNPYLGWSLVMGPALLSAWAQGPASAAALLLSFYIILVSVNAATIALLGTTRFLNPSLQHTLILLSAITLAGLGIYRLVLSVG